MEKVISFGVKARDELVKGADFLAEGVIRTLGPYGENFYIDKGNRITNDGVTAAAEIVNMGRKTIMKDGTPCNEFNRRGARALYEAASKTNDIAGDGTTTAVLFAQAIYKRVVGLLAKTGVIGTKRPSEIIKQLEVERKEVTEKLIAMSEKITTKDQLIASAVVSTEDRELGALIGEAQWDVGPDGFLLAEETAERTSSVEKVRGVRIDNGFGTSQIINNPEKGTLEVEDSGIILTSHTIKTIEDWNSLMKLFEPAFKAGHRQIVVVARAWTDETVSYCLQNINKGALKIYPLSAPYVNMTERMKDLAAVTGATFYDSENSTLDDMYTSGIGQVQKVVAKRMEAILTGKDDEKTAALVQARVEVLKKELDGEVSEFAKKQLQERISQLSNGFAIVKVGSPSDMERKRLFDKCEDAVNAVRAAFQEGTVPGAGLAFKQIADELPDDYLLKRPLMALNEQILASAPSDFVVEDWVRDPVKVLRVALEQACVAAGSFATAGGVSTDAWPDEIATALSKRVE